MLPAPGWLAVNDWKVGEYTTINGIQELLGYLNSDVKPEPGFTWDIPLVSWIFFIQRHWTVALIIGREPSIGSSMPLSYKVGTNPRLALLGILSFLYPKIWTLDVEGPMNRNLSNLSLKYC